MITILIEFFTNITVILASCITKNTQFFSFQIWENIYFHFNSLLSFYMWKLFNWKLIVEEIIFQTDFFGNENERFCWKNVNLFCMKNNQFWILKNIYLNKIKHSLCSMLFYNPYIGLSGKFYSFSERSSVSSSYFATTTKVWLNDPEMYIQSFLLPLHDSHLYCWIYFASVHC